MLPALVKSRQTFLARLIRCMLALAIHGLISSSVSAGRRFVPAALSLALASCGGTPVSPESSLLPLTPGNYVLVGFAQPLSNCQGTGAFQGVTLLSYITLSRQGTAWLARSASPADGDVELSFEEKGTSLTTLVLAGTVRGTARISGARLLSASFRWRSRLREVRARRTCKGAPRRFRRRMHTSTSLVGSRSTVRLATGLAHRRS